MPRSRVHASARYLKLYLRELRRTYPESRVRVVENEIIMTVSASTEAAVPEASVPVLRLLVRPPHCSEHHTGPVVVASHPDMGANAPPPLACGCLLVLLARSHGRMIRRIDRFWCVWYVLPFQNATVGLAPGQRHTCDGDCRQTCRNT